MRQARSAPCNSRYMCVHAHIDCPDTVTLAHTTSRPFPEHVESCFPSPQRGAGCKCTLGFTLMRLSLSRILATFVSSRSKPARGKWDASPRSGTRTRGESPIGHRHVSRPCGTGPSPAIPPACNGEANHGLPTDGAPQLRRRGASSRRARSYAGVPVLALRRRSPTRRFGSQVSSRLPTPMQMQLLQQVMDVILDRRYLDAESTSDVLI